MKPPLALPLVLLVLGLPLSGLGRVAPTPGVPPQPSGEPVQTAADLARSFGGSKAIARPSRDSTLSFAFPAEIAEVLVIGGAEVKKGDVLIRANDQEFRQQRDLQKLLAESELDIRRAAVAVDQAQVEYTAQEDIQKRGGGSQVDLDRARTLLAARQVEAEIATFQQAQQVLQLAIQNARLDRFVIKAPFDARVDQIVVDIGEVKKDGEPVVRVVATDPLWIDVPAPTAETIMLGLKPGAKAWTLLDLPGEARIVVGKIIEVAAEADSASSTRRVRVELPNPEDWPAGIAAWVRFTEPTGEWTARMTAASTGANK